MSNNIIGVKLWNQLGANVHNVKIINIFKHIIKNMFISSDRAGFGHVEAHGQPSVVEAQLIL